MSKFEKILGEVCSVSLDQEYSALEQQMAFNDRQTKKLESDLILILAHRMLSLPIEYLNLLFLYYCFGFSIEDIVCVLEIDRVQGKLRYVKMMLSEIMGLDGTLIDDASLEQASQIALQQYTAIDSTETMTTPHYSLAFRKRLKEIKAAQNNGRPILFILKRVAIIFLVCAIGCSSVLVANAQLRERFLGWLVETFPQFSTFMTQDEDPEQSDISLNAFVIGYLPDGFILQEQTEMRTMVVFQYEDSGGKTLSIQLDKSNDRLFKDTEDAILNEIPFKDNTAIWWERDGITHFVWQQDSITGNITATLPIEEVVKVAESIKIP